jgi:uncharacterized protein
LSPRAKPKTQPPRLGLVLTPGASATRDHSALVAIDKALTADGVVVERIDLKGTRAPALIKTIGDAAAALADKAGLEPGHILLGGRSMGGRMCSMAVAEGLPSAGLVLVSYPLHPPGKPDQLRTDHFPALDVPCLFVSGRRDTFGTPDELEAATAAIPGSVTHVWLEGSHGLKGQDVRVAEAVLGWVSKIVTKL